MNKKTRNRLEGKKVRKKDKHEKMIKNKARYLSRKICRWIRIDRWIKRRDSANRIEFKQ